MDNFEYLLFKTNILFNLDTFYGSLLAWLRSIFIYFSKGAFRNPTFIMNRTLSLVIDDMDFHRIKTYFDLQIYYFIICRCVDTDDVQLFLGRGSMCFYLVIHQFLNQLILGKTFSFKIHYLWVFFFIFGLFDGWLNSFWFYNIRLFYIFFLLLLSFYTHV